MPRMLLLLFACIFSAAVGKVVDGTIRLSSQVTEEYIAKFSFSPYEVSTVNGTFHTDKKEYFDGHPHELTICFYSDSSWKKFRELIEKGSLCKERQALANQKFRIEPSLSTKRHSGPRYDFDFNTKLTMPRRRSHYWYAMLMDCFLEEYDAHPPSMHFDITFKNGNSHLPADEKGMIMVNAVVLGLMLCYGLIFGLNLFHRWISQKQAHLITLLFGAAYFLQMLSILCELCHLRTYEVDGKGLRWRHTWLALDFMSGVLQSSSELLISTLLISLAFGWTLNFTSADAPVEGALGRLVSGLQRPAKLLSGFKSPSLCLLTAIAVSQLALQALGRRYEEDFNNFHDHEHWPGLVLILIRLALCALFVFAMRRSLNHEEQEGVRDFLALLLVYGLIWYFCLPLLVALAMALPPYHRHFVVAGGSVLLQAGALTLLSTLFLKSSHYYRISSLAHMGSVLDSGFGKAGKLAVD